MRSTVERWRQDESKAGHCVANFSYVYDRHIRALAGRLAGFEHEHHDLVATSTTLRLDHHHSLVCVMLKGPTEKVRQLVNRMTAERGVRYADLNLIAVDPGDDHDRADSYEHDRHGHLSPLLR